MGGGGEAEFDTSFRLTKSPIKMKKGHKYINIK